MSRIVAIIGGPSTGKTAVINELRNRGYPVIEEAARQEIDEGLAQGKTLEEIRADVEKFQMAIVQRKLKNEKKWSNHGKEVVFVDRGMHDTWAYLKHENIELDDELESLLKNHRYYKVFILDMLGDYNEQDYARTESKEEAEELHRLTELAYTRYGVEVNNIPAMSVKKRADYILNVVSHDHQ